MVNAPQEDIKKVDPLPSAIESSSSLHGPPAQPNQLASWKRAHKLKLVGPLPVEQNAARKSGKEWPEVRKT